MALLGLGKRKAMEIDELRELSAGDILGKLADVTDQIIKARQDYQTLQTIFLKMDERTAAVDQMTSEMRTEIADMRTRIVEMQTAVSQISSKLADVAAVKTKVHAAQGDIHELQAAVERMNAILGDIDKLFKYLKSPGF